MSHWRLSDAITATKTQYKKRQEIPRRTLRPDKKNRGIQWCGRTPGRFRECESGRFRQLFQAVILGGSFISAGAQAALVENLTIANPRALALGHAVTADPPGVDSIHFNPAGLARIEGREGLFKLTAAYFNFRADFGSYDAESQEQIAIWGQGETDPVENSVSETDEIVLKIPFMEGRQDWPLPVMIVPTGGAAFRPEGKGYTLGTAAFAPMAAGYIRGDDDPGRFMGKEMSLTRITYFSPSIGFKLSDEWSVGMGVHFSYQGLSAYTDLRVNHVALGIINNLLDELDEQSDCLAGLLNICDNGISPFEQSVTLEVDVETALSVTGVFGALWEPTPWFTWGFVYHTETTNRMTGTYRMTYSEDWTSTFGAIYNDPVLGPVARLLGLPMGLSEQTGDADVDLKTPAHFATGISCVYSPTGKSISMPNGPTGKCGRAWRFSTTNRRNSVPLLPCWHRNMPSRIC